jgi:TolB-like protein/Flp pilus assembly protein TadD
MAVLSAMTHLLLGGRPAEMPVPRRTMAQSDPESPWKGLRHGLKYSERPAGRLAVGVRKVVDEPGLSFGRWRLLPRSRRLFAGDVAVPLGSRACDLLLALVQARGGLVSKEELLRQVWPGTVVEENSLQVQMSALRKALGEDAAGLIATVPGRGYRFTGTVEEAAAAPLPPADSSRPTLVVLPFANMTTDPEQEYFADGITADLTTGLSHLRWFSVIAHNSAFTYKGRAVDVRVVGRELGVRYVLEGSVRKAGGRVRIGVRLCEAETARQVWAARFDGDLADIFDLQDRITESVTGAIEPSLRQAELERVRARPTESLTAYDLYLRALPQRHTTPEGNDEALRLLRRAVALDPDFTAAAGALAHLGLMRVSQGWAEPGDAEEAVRCARRVVERGSADDPAALARAGYALSFLARDYEAGVAATDRALRLAPNSAEVLLHCGWTRMYVGDWETALAQVQRAMRLSPADPLGFYHAVVIASAYFIGERYEDAIAWARRAIGERPSYLTPHRLLAASRALLGRVDEAREAVRALLAVAPGDTLAAVAAHTATRGTARERYLDGLRRAGLPE